MSEAQAPLVNVLSLTTQNGFAPSGSLLTGFPTVTGGVPAEGYQGGLYINGMALFTPHLYANSISQGTLLAYTGGSGGTFHCTTPSTCAANYSWFDMTTLSPFCPSGYGTCPSQDSASGYTCGQVVDNNSVVYYIPGASQQFPVMMAFNALGSGGVTNPANYKYFSSPAKTSGSPLGAKYGWCTGVFDGRYVYYAPTNGGSAFSNSNLLRYDTQGAGGFVITNFSNFDLSGLPGAGNNCCYESSAYDGQQKIYLLPQGGYLTIYDTKAGGGFTASSSYKVLNMANLGTTGNPQVTGNGNLNAIQTLNSYIGGQMVWNPAGTIEYLYMAPFGNNPGTSHADTILLSDVIRVPVATCSPGSTGRPELQRDLHRSRHHRIQLDVGNLRSRESGYESRMDKRRSCIPTTL